MDTGEINKTKKSSVKDVYGCLAENCSLTFTRPAILERHQLQHEWEHLDEMGEKWFCCDICPKMYKMFQILEKHRRSHCHPGQTNGCITFKPNTPKPIYNFYKTQVKQEPIQNIVVKMEPFLSNSEDEPIKCESEENNFVQKDVKTEPLEMPTDPNACKDQSYVNATLCSSTNTMSVPDLKQNKSNVMPIGPDLMRNHRSGNKQTSTSENIQEESINLSSQHNEEKSLTQERWDFFRSHRTPSEEVSQYIYRITKLAVNCEFRYFNLEAALLQSLLENVPEKMRNYILREEFDLDEAMRYAETVNLDIDSNEAHEVINPTDYLKLKVENYNSYDEHFMDSNEIIDHTNNLNNEINEEYVKVKYFEVSQSGGSSSIKNKSNNVKEGHLNISKVGRPRKPLVFCARCKKTFKMQQFEIHKFKCFGVNTDFRKNTNTYTFTQEDGQEIKHADFRKKIKLSQPELTFEYDQLSDGTISDLPSSLTDTIRS